jgi:hypothetical protein
MPRCESNCQRIHVSPITHNSGDRYLQRCACCTSSIILLHTERNRLHKKYSHAIGSDVTFAASFIVDDPWSQSNYCSEPSSGILYVLIIGNDQLPDNNSLFKNALSRK